MIGGHVLLAAALLLQGPTPASGPSAGKAAAHSMSPSSPRLAVAETLTVRRHGTGDVPDSAAFRAIPSVAGTRPTLGTRGTRGVPRTIKTDAALRVEESTDLAPVDLVIPGLGQQPIEVVRRGDHALIPLGMLGRFAGLPIQVATATRWVGQIEERGPQLEVDVAARTLQYGATRRALDSAEAASRNNEVYLSTQTLMAVTGLEVQMDWSSLSAQVLRADKLPASARRARLLARQALQLAAKEEQAALTLPVQRHLLRGFVLDYSVNGPLAGGHPSNGVYLVAGTELLGGGLEVRDNLRTGVASPTGGYSRFGIAQQDVTALWTTGWEHGPVRQVRLGEIGGTGVIPRLVQGVAISNAPYRRGSRFGMRAYEGQLGPQWQIEVYQNGVLVTVDSTDAVGRYRVEVPVQYGENPVELVGYGPGGERRTLMAQTRIPTTLLPRGRVEYGVSGGRCATYHCETTANGDLRVGVASGVVLLGGTDYFTRPSGASLVSPYGGVVIAGPGGFSAEALAQPQGVSRVELHLDPHPRARLEASARQYAFADTLNPYALPRGRQREFAFSGMLRSGGPRAAMIEGGASRVTDVGGTRTDYLSASGSVQLGPVSMQPYTRANLRQTGTSRTNDIFTGGRFNLTVPRIVRERAGVSSIALEGEMRPGDGVSYLAASVMQAVGAAFRTTTRAEWRPGQGALLTLTATLDRTRVRVTSTVTTSARGVQDNSQVSGSVRMDDQFFLTADDGVQRGSIVGTAFLDENNNGRRDPGEPGVPHVALSTEYRMTETDAQGHYVMRGLDPYQAVTVAVDTNITPDPSVAAKYLQVRATPIAHSAARADLPFLPSGTLEGVVLLGDGGGLYPQANVPLDVVDLKTGRMYRTASFADGSFYLTGILPSEYAIAVRPDVQDIRQWDAARITALLPAVPGGAYVRGIRVVVTRKPQVATR